MALFFLLWFIGNFCLKACLWKKRNATNILNCYYFIVIIFISKFLLKKYEIQIMKTTRKHQSINTLFLKWRKDSTVNFSFFLSCSCSYLYLTWNLGGGIINCLLYQRRHTILFFLHWPWFLCPMKKTNKDLDDKLKSSSSLCN